MTLTEDFITEAAGLNRENLTPEQREIALETEERRIERDIKNPEFGDQWRRVLKAKEEGVWTAEALALQDWSLLDTGNAFRQTGSIGMLMFASFVGGDGELYDRAAIMQGWANKYEPEAGSRIITHADMQYSSESFRNFGQAERPESALDSAGASFRAEFPAKAAEPVETPEPPSVEVSPDEPGLPR